MKSRDIRDQNQRVSMSIKAFSLVEILIVIAIIGILASVAVPQIKKLNDNAKKTKDQRNAQQIASLTAAALAAGACDSFIEDGSTNTVDGCFRASGVCDDSGGLMGSGDEGGADVGATASSTVAKIVKILEKGCEAVGSENSLQGTVFSVGDLTSDQANGLMWYLNIRDGMIQYNKTAERQTGAHPGLGEYNSFEPPEI